MILCADNGSTAVEVALKMAFRAYMQQHQLSVSGQRQDGSMPLELQVGVVLNKSSQEEEAHPATFFSIIYTQFLLLLLLPSTR